MTIQQSGIILANQIVDALNLPAPPTNPTPDQQNAYLTARQAQIDVWTVICNKMLTYLVQNTVVSTIDNNPVSGGDTGTGSIS